MTVASPQHAIAQAFDGGASTAADRPMHLQHFAGTGVAPQLDARDGYTLGLEARVGSGAVRPVVGTIPTAGGFGGRHVAGCGACSTNHQGLDFAAPSGTPVHAVLSGVVVTAGTEGGYGRTVVIRHADGFATRAAHLSRIDVHVGQHVDTDAVIGLVGSTGVSTGAHLHFEVLVRGAAIDPAPWLRARGLL